MLQNTIKNKLISQRQSKIKLLLLLGCHSYGLEKKFAKYLPCIICVHPLTEIEDKTCVRFRQYFYKEVLPKMEKNNGSKTYCN